MSPKRRLEDVGGEGGKAAAAPAPPPRRSRSFDRNVQDRASSSSQEMEIVNTKTNAFGQQLTSKMLGSEEASPFTHGTHESINIIVKELQHVRRSFDFLTSEQESVSKKLSKLESIMGNLIQGHNQDDNLTLGKTESIEQKNQFATRKENSGSSKLTEKDNLTRKQRSAKKKIQNLNQKENIPPCKLGTMDRIQAVVTQTELQSKPACSCHNNSNIERSVQELKQEAKDGGLGTNNGGMGEIKSLHLRFLSKVEAPVYHDDEIKPDRNAAIRIGIFSGETMIRSGPLSKLKIEILALEGDFPYSQDSWSAEFFSRYIALGRDGNGNVLVGEGTTAQLNGGECDVGRIKFREGSCRARKGMFVMAARVREGERTGGVRVQEAVMAPVVVKDRRNKFNQKSYPPQLEEMVHCLEAIARDGKHYKKLAMEKIFSVQDFLRALNKDPDNLMRVLGTTKEHKSWKKMVEHAKQCSLEDKHALIIRYAFPEENVVLFFNWVYCLVGAEFYGHYTACDKFDLHPKVLVDKLKGRAYEKLDDCCADYAMEDNRPVRLCPDTNVGSGVVPPHMSSAARRNLFGQLTVPQVGATAAIEGLGHAEAESPSANANNDPAPDSHNIHDYQVDFASSHEDILEGAFCWQDSGNSMIAHSNMTFTPPHPTITVDSASGHEEIPGVGGSSWQDNYIFQASMTAHNMTLTPQKSTIITPDTPGSGQGSTQSQMMHAPLPLTNGALEPSASALQDTLHLPPSQWSHRQGNMRWNRLH